MNNDRDSRRRAHAEKNEAVFSFGVFRVVEQAPVGIAEYTQGFFKPNSMLGPGWLGSRVRPNRTAIYLDYI